MKKEAIVQLLIEEQKTVILDLEKAVSVYKKSSDIDEDDTLDPEDFSHQSEAKEMQLRLENKLSREKDVLEILKKYQHASFNSIEKGALVETEEYYFYVGVAAHPVVFNNKKVMSVSEKAPLMSVFKEKEIGSKVLIGNKTETILKIS